LNAVGDTTFGASALGIARNVTITGQNVGITLSRSGPEMRLFYVGSSVVLTLDQLTLTNGLIRGAAGANGGGGGAGLGGAIFNTGVVHITGCTFTGNQAIGGAGSQGFKANVGEANSGGGGGGVNTMGQNP